MKLLTESNPKVSKGAGRGYHTAVLHLAPASLSGFNVCQHATEGCIAGCLNLAGRGGIFKRGETTNRIQEARVRRTQMYFKDRPAFVAQLSREIDRHVARARELGLKPAVRLNGTSDLPWERIPAASWLFERFRDVQFYDYTKDPDRAMNWTLGKLPDNYHLTLSATEHTTHDDIAGWLDHGINVAVVYHAMPDKFDGDLPVINGDEHDLRFLDPSPVIVGLKAKGPAKRDRSGFVRDPQPIKA